MTAKKNQKIKHFAVATYTSFLSIGQMSCFVTGFLKLWLMYIVFGNLRFLQYGQAVFAPSLSSPDRIMGQNLRFRGEEDGEAEGDTGNEEVGDDEQLT